EILELARSKEQEAINLYPIVLAETIRESITLLEHLAQKKEIYIQTDLDESIIVQGDEEKLKQIFINVIENAICYSNEESTINVLTKSIKGNAIVEIADKGIGIPKEDLPYVTQKFYRVNKARSRADGGSGLGLSIVDQLVKLHHGKLFIQSEEGKGTTVTITVPLLEE
ncbi:GHKL domain-containing protein, partial [Butyricicoccus sp. 1XD8-22]